MSAGIEGICELTLPVGVTSLDALRKVDPVGVICFARFRRLDGTLSRLRLS